MCSPRSCFTIFHMTRKGQNSCSDQRVLKPDGEFHMLDFEGPEDSEHSFLARLLHSGHRLKDNS